jgi:hypothetical protein
MFELLDLLLIFFKDMLQEFGLPKDFIETTSYIWAPDLLDRGAAPLGREQIWYFMPILV